MTHDRQLQARRELEATIFHNNQSQTAREGAVDALPKLARWALARRPAMTRRVNDFA